MTKKQVIETLEDMGAIQGFGVYNQVDDSYYIAGYKGYIVPYNLNDYFSRSGDNNSWGFLLMDNEGWGTNYTYKSGLEKIREIIMNRFDRIYLEMKQRSLMFV